MHLVSSHLYTGVSVCLSTTSWHFSHACGFCLWLLPGNLKRCNASDSIGLMSQQRRNSFVAEAERTIKQLAFTRDFYGAELGTVSKLGRLKSQLSLDLFMFQFKIELTMFPVLIRLTIFWPLDFFPQSAEVMKKKSFSLLFFYPLLCSPRVSEVFDSDRQTMAKCQILREMWKKMLLSLQFQPITMISLVHFLKLISRTSIQNYSTSWCLIVLYIHNTAIQWSEHWPPLSRLGPNQVKRSGHTGASRRI